MEIVVLIGIFAIIFVLIVHYTQKKKSNIKGPPNPIPKEVLILDSELDFKLIKEFPVKLQRGEIYAVSLNIMISNERMKCLIKKLNELGKKHKVEFVLLPFEVTLQ